MPETVSLRTSIIVVTESLEENLSRGDLSPSLESRPFSTHGLKPELANYAQKAPKMTKLAARGDYAQSGTKVRDLPHLFSLASPCPLGLTQSFSGSDSDVHNLIRIIICNIKVPRSFATIARPLPSSSIFRPCSH